MSEQRAVRYEGKDPDDHFNVIDGEYVEQFLSLDSKAQHSIVSQMLINQSDMSELYVGEVRELVQLLQQLAH